MPTFVLQNGWSNNIIITSSLDGHLDVVKALIKAGANINQADEDTTLVCSVIVIHSHKICMCTLYDIIASDEYIPLFVYI